MDTSVHVLTRVNMLLDKPLLLGRQCGNMFMKLSGIQIESKLVKHICTIFLKNICECNL